MIEKLKNAKKRITELLTLKPELRDSDERLIANLWYSQMGKERVNGMDAKEVLRLFSEGQLVSPETIRRCRQKIQEQNPELRGKSYKARQKKGVETKQEIHNL